VRLKKNLSTLQLFRSREAGAPIRLEKMTSRVLILLLITLAASHRSYAQGAPHIRFLDPVLKELFDHGMHQSPTLRALVEKVEAAPILVFIEGDIRMPSFVGARLNFVTSVNGLRYVRVDIDCTLSPRRQIALLAHELQHALEIGERTDILDADGMESLYEEIGFQSNDNGAHKSYETEAAKAIQRAVDDELGMRQARGTTGANAY
jgi:hypothetical protein